MTAVTAPTPIDGPLLALVESALSFGPATRTDLLSAAVTARSSTPVIELLLALPERGYTDVADIREALAEAS